MQRDELDFISKWHTPLQMEIMKLEDRLFKARFHLGASVILNVLLAGVIGYLLGA